MFLFWREGFGYGGLAGIPTGRRSGQKSSAERNTCCRQLNGQMSIENEFPENSSRNLNTPEWPPM